jgi:hypothetical protein
MPPALTAADFQIEVVDPARAIAWNIGMFIP